MPKLQTTINALKGTIKFVESHSVVTLACDDSFVRMLKDALVHLEGQKKVKTYGSVILLNRYENSYQYALYRIAQTLIDNNVLLVDHNHYADCTEVSWKLKGVAHDA